MLSYKVLFMHLRELTSIRLSSAYDKKGLVLRIICDVLLSNAGLFLGYFFSLIYYFASGKTKVFLWGGKFLLAHWLNTVPIFTVVCIASFTLSGLYSRGIRHAPLYRLTIAVRKLSRLISSDGPDYANAKGASKTGYNL